MWDGGGEVGGDGMGGGGERGSETKSTFSVLKHGPNTEKRSKEHSFNQTMKNMRN